ncbi:cofactor-independent phosphoglycerate mutase [Methanospirillum sp. J.3.6.1-F.2.7.3]|uniref:phosphoglycerate mutase (2,3-diphosphoglycerate-independent) n=1 Tax=Methanospirillum purgamenti TaxID=2834276 RepID=A0A8E7AZ69_9EURY|nr:MULTISPECIES: cofactor-independent phosphoglycerate mutase [Methanospirillum]MDX8550421.1 cofactor-independent phosphoglycerate mutase [Methanospirillum hungatei]QVV88118.1 cofactor-independent phosphoglycerate mutase [Methanospirillum sp. J.3.6.1-F.2.7.3]
MSEKYCIILGDGMADEPLAELSGMTPLEAAHTPNMDYIAREGSMGLLKTVPEGYSPGSDIANLSVLGYDPVSCYTGRGALEAASMGITLGDEDVAYRCNLVTIRNGIIEDFNAGHISSEEGAALLTSLNKHLTGMICYPGISYRNLIVLPGGKGCESTAPHDVTGQQAELYLPKGSDAEKLLKAMEISREIFADHPVNRDRIRREKNPATSIWPWSGGKHPAIQPFSDIFGLKGGIISAVDLLNGIGTYAKMEIIKVPGATGFIDTDYQAKARYAIEALKYLDFLFIHVEAPDEAGHMGSIEEKVKAIERVDEMIGTIMSQFTGRIAVLPDHPTPIRIKTHTADPVPFAILGKEKDTTTRFSEKEGQKGKYGLLPGTSLIPLLIS